MSLKAVDLFCGCGGLSAGLIQSGINVVAAYDNWEPALNTYRRNIGDHADTLDITDVRQVADSIASTKADIVAGGPPCQDFSTAGKRIEAGRANLTLAFGRVIEACDAPYFLMENVPQVRLSETYRTMKARLVAAGYDVVEIVLDASLCGVPQSRKRFFAFGSKAGRASRFIKSLNERLASEKMTVKAYFGSDIDIQHYYRHPRNYSRRSVFSVHEPSPTVRGVNRPVPKAYKGNHLDSVDPQTVRPLTTVERSRVQTFPKSWDWNCSDRNSDAEMQIGNAVPVSLASFVGRGVRDAVR